MNDATLEIDVVDPTDDPIDLSILASHHATSAFGLISGGLILTLFTVRRSISNTLSVDLVADWLGWGLIIFALAKISAMSPRVARLRTLAVAALVCSIANWVHVDADPRTAITILQLALSLTTFALALYFMWHCAGLIARMAEVAREDELKKYTISRRRLLITVAGAFGLLALPSVLGLEETLHPILIALGFSYLAGVGLYLELVWRTRKFCQRHERLRAEAEIPPHRETESRSTR